MTYVKFLRTVPASVLGTLLAVSTAPLASAETGAQAQADGRYVEEILVTARKREESVLEIPESLSVITGVDIARQNLKTLDKVGLMVPNLNLSTRLDGFPNVSIRGVGAFGNTQGVGFYLDDVQIFSDASSRFGDLERIEVLKGPQGTLYGGSNIGGAVKFVSARPDPEEAFGRVKVLGGEQGLWDVEASVNAPLGENGWAMRLFGFGANSDGYLKQQNPVRISGGQGNENSNPGRYDEYGVRGMIAGPLSENLSAFASLRWNEFDGPNNTWIRELSLDDFEHHNIVNPYPNPRHERETISAMVELVLALDSMDIVSTTSYTDTDSIRETDVDIHQDTTLWLYRPERMNVFTQELRFTSTTDAPLQWLGGVYYSLYDEKMDSTLDVLDPFTEALVVTVPFEFRRRDKSHLAAFANVTYEVEDWEFGAGLRVDQWKNKSLNYDVGLESGLKETEVLPRGSITRWLNDDNMIYATIAFGYEPGGLNIGEFGLLPFSAEKAASYEIGWKGRFADGRGSASIAGFYIDYDKRQVEYHIATPAGPVEGIGNFGDSRQIGFEADLAVQVSDALRLSFAAGLIDAEWVGETIQLGIDFEGEKPPNVPEFSWNANADVRHPISDSMDFIAGLQISQTGASDTIQAYYPLRNPKYVLVSAQIGVAGENWEFTVNAENLTDKGWYPDVQSFPAFRELFVGTPVPVPSCATPDPDQTPCIGIGTLGQPRLITASLSFFF
jgi:iron complex outermembrane receptor protein